MIATVSQIPIGIGQAPDGAPAMFLPIRFIPNDAVNPRPRQRAAAQAFPLLADSGGEHPAPPDRPRLARCPGCSCDLTHPTARACDRIGCPVRHLAPHHHDGSNAR